MTVDRVDSANAVGEGIEVSSVSKVFGGRAGTSVLALDDLSIDPIQPGEFVTIVGRSGCGKSTLLKIVAGLLPFEEGEVLLGGTPVRGPSTKVGMVFQSPELVPWRTALGNVLLAADLANASTRASRRTYRERAQELLTLVGLGGFETAHPYELSGGMQHRNAIARSLLLRPSVLLMDEPFAALDALTRDELMMELQQIWMRSGCTVLFVTHNITEAVLLSDRVVVLSSRPGRLMIDKRIEFQRPRALTLEAEPEFGRIVNELRAALGLLEEE